MRQFLGIFLALGTLLSMGISLGMESNKRDFEQYQEPEIEPSPDLSSPHGSPIKRARNEEFEIVRIQAFPFLKLPVDVQHLILSEAKNAEKVRANLISLSATSKAYRAKLTSPDYTNLLINVVADRFLNGDSIRASKVLNTKASIALKEAVFPQETKLGIQLQFYRGQSFNSCFSFLNQTVAQNPELKAVFFRSDAQIWLINQLANLKLKHNRSDYVLQDCARTVESIVGPLQEKTQKWLKNAIRQNEFCDRFNIVFQEYDDYIEKSKVPEIVDKFVTEGLDVNACVSTNNILLSNVNSGNSQLVRSFLAKGAHVNEIRPPSYNATLLHTALDRFLKKEKKHIAAEEYWLIVRLLLRAGANPNIRNDKKQTVLDTIYEYIDKQRERGPFIISQQIRDLVTLLKKHGAKTGDGKGDLRAL